MARDPNERRVGDATNFRPRAADIPSVAHTVEEFRRRSGTRPSKHPTLAAARPQPCRASRAADRRSSSRSSSITRLKGRECRRAPCCAGSYKIRCGAVEARVRERGPGKSAAFPLAAAARGAGPRGDACEWSGDSGESREDCSPRAADSSPRAGDSSLRAADSSLRAGDCSLRAGDSSPGAGDSSLRADGSQVRADGSAPRAGRSPPRVTGCSPRGTTFTDRWRLAPAWVAPAWVAPALVAPEF
jgi:hypothetical protein